MVETKSPPARNGKKRAGTLKALRSSADGTMTHQAAAEARANKVGVRGCVQALFTTLSLFGLQDDARDRDVPTTVEHWCRAANMLGTGGWMKWAKYKFAAFFYAHTAQLDEPVPPPLADFVDSPRILCNGRSGRWLNTLLRAGDRRADELLASVLQIKKGCPRPDKILVDLAVEKTRKSLTTTRPAPREVASLIDWADIEPHCPPGLPLQLTRATVEGQLRRTVREIFGGTKYTWRDRLRPIFPSVASSNETSRAEGGQFTSLRKLAEALGLTTYTQDAPLGPSLVVNEAVPVRHHVYEEMIEAPEHTRYVADVTQLERRFGTLYLAALKLAEQELPIATPVGLAESNKVRVITKGPPATSFVLKPLQKFLWETLAKHPAFVLIGTPVTARIVNDRLGNMLRPGEGYNSGDYSDATNEIAPWVSEAIVDELSTVLRLPAVERDLFRKALTGHLIGTAEEFVPQAWGQLMGSVVSFPVLCIANAALCRWAIELSQQRTRLLRDTTLLVNGDDCVFRTNARGLQYWKLITSFSGLTPSVGKFFFTRDFAQINSVNFKRLQQPRDEKDNDGVVRPIYFEATKFVNLGLLLGLKRSGEKVGSEAIADSRNGLGTRCRELLATAPADMAPALLSAFVKHHRSVLDTSKLTPWFLPEWYGGVGLPQVAIPRTGSQPEDIDDYLANRKYMFGGMTRLDRQIAARLREDPLKYPVGRLPGETSWDVHRIVASRLPAAPSMLSVTPDRREAIASKYSRVYGLLAVDALFSARDVMAESDSSRMHHVLKRNERTFERVKKGGSLPPPLSVATVLGVCLDKPLLDFEITSVNDDKVGPRGLPTLGANMALAVQWHGLPDEDDLW